ncbi:hypothetical protein PVAP13_3KG217327 [Panicum virgatum]|uniref:Uncharacterized protein n=1 Tax=Panicum virgatum TaxID=38727 RepID=A0A8T0UNE2_PANVG|nr:hypothetical protein PVAP13_3KG217327 [Panicum virgatum]
MSGWDSLCTGVCLFFLGDAVAVVFPGLVVATWCSGRDDDGGRGLKSAEPTTAGLLPSTSCSLPKLGVRSLISQGEDGRWSIWGVSQAWVKQHWLSAPRRTKNSGSEDLVVIYRLLRDLSIRRECFVLSFLI